MAKTGFNLICKFILILASFQAFQSENMWPHDQPETS